MRNRLMFCACAFSILLITVSATPAQVPDEFKNLKVLPADIGKDELVATMKNFAVSLGVRCEFCHAGPPGGSLDAFDFAADDKKEKEIARIMMRMKKVINGEYVNKIGHDDGGAVQVDCATCHRGKTHPDKTEAIFSEIMSGR